MRRATAIIKTTALEVLSEPLVFLVMISSMALSVLAPAMHYHEFGDASRMARDAGVSALLLGGFVVSVFAAVKSLRREIESQTAMSVLALPVSRCGFLLAKVAGILFAYCVFVLAVAAVSLAVVRGSVIGGQIAARQGTLARVYGPIFALAVSACVLPFLYGAMVNRFLHRRFTLHAVLCAVLLSFVTFAVGFESSVVRDTVPLYILVSLPSVILAVSAAVFSARFKLNVATTLALIVYGLFLPALGNYCLTDVLSAGEHIPWRYVLLAAVAELPVIAALLVLGIKLFEDAE